MVRIIGIGDFFPETGSDVQFTRKHFSIAAHTVKGIRYHNELRFWQIHLRYVPKISRTSACALRIRLGVPNQRLQNGKLIAKSARIGQIAVNEA